MEIVKLPSGESAPEDSDCISIDTADGGFNLTGAVLTDEESESLVGSLHDSREAAEAEGIAWANERGVQRLYIASDAPSPA